MMWFVAGVVAVAAAVLGVFGIRVRTKRR